MPAIVITVEDFENFKSELIQEIQKAITQGSASASRKWLKSKDVCKLLTLSPGTLQNLRINGTLPFTKIGGVIFYDPEDINQMIQDRKQNVGSGCGRRKL